MIAYKHYQESQAFPLLQVLLAQILMHIKGLLIEIFRTPLISPFLSTGNGSHMLGLAASLPP